MKQNKQTQPTVQFNICLQRDNPKDNALIEKLESIMNNMPTVTSKAQFLRFILCRFVDTYQEK